MVNDEFPLSHHSPFIIHHSQFTIFFYIAIMKKILFVFLLLVSSVAFSQEKLVVAKADSLQLHADIFLGQDVYGAWYGITENTFVKQHKAKDWQYKNPALGKIAKVDLQNPLQIVLFYESFNTAVLLDNQLNETQQVNFSKSTTPIVASAVGLAFGNRLWVYNTLTQKVGLYDYLKNDYREISTPFKGNLKYYTSDFNEFQWIDEQLDWYGCDIYGKVKTLGKAPASEQLQLISDKGLIYKKGDKLYFFDRNGNSLHLVDVDKKTFQSFLYKDKILAIFTKQGITNYKINLP